MRIYRRNNYIHIVQDDGVLLEGDAASVQVYARSLTSENFFIKGVFQGKELTWVRVHLSDIHNEQGDPYTLEGFRNFYTENTGSFDKGWVGRVEHLERTNVVYELFEITAVSSGALTLPAGAELLFGRYMGGVDALVQEVDENLRPTDVPARDAMDVLITISLNPDGTYVLSGAPVGDVAIVYWVRIALIDADGIDPDRIVSCPIGFYPDEELQTEPGGTNFFGIFTNAWKRLTWANLVGWLGAHFSPLRIAAPVASADLVVKDDTLQTLGDKVLRLQQGPNAASLINVDGTPLTPSNVEVAVGQNLRQVSQAVLGLQRNILHDITVPSPVDALNLTVDIRPGQVFSIFTHVVAWHHITQSVGRFTITVNGVGGATYFWAAPAGTGVGFFASSGTARPGGFSMHRLALIGTELVGNWAGAADNIVNEPFFLYTKGLNATSIHTIRLASPPTLYQIPAGARVLVRIER